MEWLKIGDVEPMVRTTDITNDVDLFGQRIAEGSELTAKHS